MDEVAGYCIIGLLIAGGILYLVAMIVAGIAIVLAFTLAGIYTFFVILTELLIIALDAAFSAQLTAGSPWIMWSLWGAIIGGALGFWTVAPVYRLRLLRPLIAAAPVVVMLALAGIVYVTKPSPLVIPGLERLPVLTNQESAPSLAVSSGFEEAFADAASTTQPVTFVGASNAYGAETGPVLDFSIAEQELQFVARDLDYNETPFENLIASSWQHTVGLFMIELTPCHPGPQVVSAAGAATSDYQGYYLLRVSAEGSSLVLASIEPAGGLLLWNPADGEWLVGEAGQALTIRYIIPTVGGMMGMQRQYDVNVLQIGFQLDEVAEFKNNFDRNLCTFAYPSGQLQFTSTQELYSSLPEDSQQRFTELGENLPRFARPPHWRQVTVPLKFAAVDWKNGSALYVKVLKLNLSGEEVLMEQFRGQDATGQWIVDVFSDSQHREKIMELRVKLDLHAAQKQGAGRTENHQYFEGSYVLRLFANDGTLLLKHAVDLAAVKAGSTPQPLEVDVEGRKTRIELDPPRTREITLSRDNKYSADEYYHYALPELTVRIAFAE